MTYEKNKTKYFNKYPAISDLKAKAKKRLPFVSWEYLDAGTGRESLIKRNIEAFDKITFAPQFCKGIIKPNIETQVLNQTFNAPFGVAPVGLTGLMWPKAEIILAKTAKKYNIPFSLSTVATETPETIGQHVGNNGWFQLYPPRDRDLRLKLLERAKAAEFHTLLVTADVPMASRRERTKRAGMQMPPKITPQLIWQGITHPTWTMQTLQRGLPRLRTVETYAAYNNMKFISGFVGNRLGGSLDWEYCKELRDEWDGPVVVKGILHPKDAERAVEIGLDGVVVSNHGGRQFDGALTSIEALPSIVKAVKGKTAILFDSGLRTGLDILRALHLGAEFVLLGRAFLFGVGALDNHGGDHVVEILMDDLKNNMAQLGIEKISELKNL
jgi:L-lactate dehydrogenase (cytochrome)